MNRPNQEAVAPQPTSPARVLYVVARDRLDLYAALLEAFVESPRLSIVLDRREMSTRRRSHDRRRLGLDDLLRTRGWVRVRIDPDGRATLIDENDSPRKEAHGRRADRR